MPLPDLARLNATLGRPELARLRALLQKRLEMGRELKGRIQLRDATAPERLAIDNLLGRRLTQGDRLSLDLDELAEQLRAAGIAETLADAFQALVGPVANRPALAAEANARWAARVNPFRAAWADRCAPLVPWFDELAASGLLKRLVNGDPSTAAALLETVTQVVAALPTKAEPLAHFAARLFGDAHALDLGFPRSTLAVRAAARLGGTVFEDGAEGFRAAWAVVGVMCDELSTPVLVLNLPAAGTTVLAQMLRQARIDGDPLHLSLRILLRQPLSTDPALAHREIFVCENPTIVALAAARLGAACAPLICVNGQFATPTLVLLRQLHAAGARLRYHGDFDVGGLTIARRIFGGFAAEPWQFSAQDYTEAPKGLPFDADPGPTPWSPTLAEAMRREGRAVHEEAVADRLLRDLDCRPELDTTRRDRDSPAESG